MAEADRAISAYGLCASLSCEYSWSKSVVTASRCVPAGGLQPYTNSRSRTISASAVKGGGVGLAAARVAMNGTGDRQVLKVRIERACAPQSENHSPRLSSCPFLERDWQ